LQHSGSYDGLVDREGALGGRVEQVDEEAQFEEVVEGNNLEDDARELVDDVEAAETHPIRQPHLVVVKAVAFQG